MQQYGILTAEDEMASEHEVYEFLYGLVRLLKPKVILETGFYKGGSAMAMLRAVHENGIGEVYSCDTNGEHIREFMVSSDPNDRIYLFVECYTGEYLASRIPNVDLAFIDSSGDRVAEVKALQLSPNAVVVLHDSNRPQYKPIWTIKPWKSIWHIGTEQGITVFQL